MRNELYTDKETQVEISEEIVFLQLCFNLNAKIKTISSNKNVISYLER